MEAATQRSPIGSPRSSSACADGETIDLVTDVLASGRRTAQVRVTAVVDDRVIVTSIGSTGIRTEKGLTGQFETDAGPRAARTMRGQLAGHSGWARCRTSKPFGAVEYRHARCRGDGSGVVDVVAIHRTGSFDDAGRRCVRRRQWCPLPLRAAPARWGRTSLDNSMRFRLVPGSSGDARAAGEPRSGGYGHGTVRVWSEDGIFLAVGSQTREHDLPFRRGRDANIRCSGVTQAGHRGRTPVVDDWITAALEIMAADGSAA